MIQFQENTWRVRKMDKLYFVGPVELLLLAQLTLVDERLAEQKPLLLQNLYITNESSAFSPSIDSSSL